MADDHYDVNNLNREFNSKPANTLEHTLRAYPALFLVFLYEGIQNSKEAHDFNRETLDVLPDDHKLQIDYLVDTDENTLEVIDNAGGVGGEAITTTEKFEQCFLGIDTPGEEKDNDDTAGGFGRGAATMLRVGDRFYVETRHDGTHIAAYGLAEEAKHSGASEEHVEGYLDGQGTYARIHDLDDEVIANLADADKVRQTVLTKFPTLLNDDSVEINYEVDGERIEMPDFSLSALAESAELDEEYDSELDPVTVRGHTAKVKGIRLFDARELPDDKEPPWKGILLMNSGDRDEPWMTVKQYDTVRKCRAISDGDLFGIADISEFCPEFEDAGHNGFSKNLSVSDTGLTDLLRELSRKHFSPQPNNQNIGEQARRDLNIGLAESDRLNIGEEGEANTAPVGTTTTPDRKTTSPTPTNHLTAAVPTTPEVGDTVTVTVTVENQDQIDTENLELIDISAEEILTGQTVQTPDSVSIKDGEATIDFTIRLDGRYSIEASLANADTGTIIDSTTAFFTSSDAPETATEANGGVEFVDELMWTGFGDDGPRSKAYENDDGNLVVYFNSERPEYEHASSYATTQRANNNRRALYIKWSLQAINKWILSEGKTEEFVNSDSEEDKPLSDVLNTEFARIEAKLLKQIEGKCDMRFM